MFEFKGPAVSPHHIPEAAPGKAGSMDDNLSAPTSDNLMARRKVEMTIDLRKQVGSENMQTFSGVRQGVRSIKQPLVAERIISPYANYLKETGRLNDRDAVGVVRDIASRLGKPALAQHQGNPPQYVSHGFDHSERTAGYIDRIINAYPEIEQSAARKYNIPTSLARLLFKITAHWHDIGYPDLDGRPKSTHGLSSASRFDDVRDQLQGLIQRENGRTDQVLSDMRKAIQLHSADVDAGSYPINVKTDRGALLASDVESLKELLNHYSTSSRRAHQVSAIEIRGSDAKEMEKQVNDMLQKQSSAQPIKVTADDTKVRYAGRPAALEKNNQVKIGLRYTEQELTRNPFAIIRFADNLDMAANRLSPFQRSPVFQTMYWKLGDHGPIGRALSELNRLDDKNTSGVLDVSRNLRSAAAANKSIDLDSSILLGVVSQFSPALIRGVDASAARRLLTRATVDSVLSSPLAGGLSGAERTTLREVGYRMNGETLLHFGGCEAIENVDVKPGKIVVSVNGPLYRKLNEVKNPAGIGVGEYQIERARQALASLSINGRRPSIEVVAQNQGGRTPV
ncbi:hypothetical protein [Paraburkholderia rhizosphaerae]|uniref:Uncharacterized protein n=1 Tax=Paraburkholderia rhizosphaerae TaxID=480658 RepID=A0A4R8L5E3_9BURK|nr:hypothetical protein [Paraburkholderia rhizosphaerae]TDY37209.1 hypothetical protein BX592_14114 [Paraburkholderia rhizosphaerae]